LRPPWGGHNLAASWRIAETTPRLCAFAFSWAGGWVLHPEPCIWRGGWICVHLRDLRADWAGRESSCFGASIEIGGPVRSSAGLVLDRGPGIFGHGGGK
jgi:hypothetical protein